MIASRYFRKHAANVIHLTLWLLKKNIQIFYLNARALHLLSSFYSQLFLPKNDRFINTMRHFHLILENMYVLFFNFTRLQWPNYCLINKYLSACIMLLKRNYPCELRNAMYPSAALNCLTYSYKLDSSSPLLTFSMSLINESSQLLFYWIGLIMAQCLVSFQNGLAWRNISLLNRNIDGILSLCFCQADKFSGE